MSGLHVPAQASAEVNLGGSDLSLVVVVGVIALLALAVAAVLVREVLAAGQGTEKMQEIARASKLDAVRHALQESDGHRGLAARKLGISERTLRYRIAELRDLAMP